MKIMIVSIRNVGSSRGALPPKPVLARRGVEGDERQMELTVENGAIVLRRAAAARSGWAEAAAKVSAAGGDKLLMGEFGNEADSEIDW